jgi:murein DD-endopeptidase MepM/ murein hydrolase activator NlpD
MGKLTAIVDWKSQINTASVAGWKTELKIRARKFWEVAKRDIRATFTVRNSIAALAVVVITAVGMDAVSDKVANVKSIYRVYIDGQYIGVVKDKTLIEDQIASYGPKMKAKVSLEPVNQYVPFTSEWSVANAIDESTKTMTDMIAVRVDGRDIVYVKDQATADELIKRVKANFAKADAQSVSLANDVDFVKVRGDKQQITDLAPALTMILQGKEQKKTYVVSRGDSLWDIAAKNNMSIDELARVNPEIANIDQIAEGQQINLSALQPLISVQTVAEETREILKPFQIETREDSSLDMGTSRVLQEGVNGKSKQVVRVTRKNGLIDKEEVLSEEVIQAPQNEVVVKGTKKQTYSSYAGTATASGSWAYPVGGGYISSQYGENRGGKPHLAIDIAAATGTPVYASNNGTVISAGDAGDGYGNCIRISHGNGVVTLYAHLSAIHVSVGQSVQKGQRIGSVGSTGWSTGSHLHYEAIVNGVKVNPRPYM